MLSKFQTEIRNVRRPAVAGHFYPADKVALLRQLETFFQALPDFPAEKPPKALIVPHAGYDYSGQVAAYAYALLQAFGGRWRKVVAISPAHTVSLHGLATDSHDHWESPLGTVEICRDGFPVDRSAHRQEHGLEVQVPFLQYTLDDFQLLPLVAGKTDPIAGADEVLSALSWDTLLLISSDLSHFYNYQTAREIDLFTIEAIEQLDAEAMKSAGVACGKTPILIAMEIARRRGWDCRLLYYENSGDQTGDLTRVVGYASFAFL